MYPGTQTLDRRQSLLWPLLDEYQPILQTYLTHTSHLHTVTLAVTLNTTLKSGGDSRRLRGDVCTRMQYFLSLCSFFVR